MIEYEMIYYFLLSKTGVDVLSRFSLTACFALLLLLESYGIKDGFLTVVVIATMLKCFGYTICIFFLMYPFAETSRLHC